MKWSILMLLFAAGISQPAAAGFYTGNNLLELCQDRDRVSACMTYIAGITDVLFANNFKNRRACPQSLNEITIAQVRDITVQWLQRNPQLRQYSSAPLVAQALEESFPCR
jgi:Rap1a immunity proteins